MGGVEAGDGAEGLLGRYLNRIDGRPFAATTITAIDITVRTPRPSRPATRRHRITAAMSTGPRRGWTGKELAELLQVK